MMNSKMITNRKISEQIIDFVKEHEEKVNREPFSVLEFVIQAGQLIGMRVKDFIKNTKK